MFRQVILHGFGDILRGDGRKLVEFCHDLRIYVLRWGGRGTSGSEHGGQRQKPGRPGRVDISGIQAHRHPAGSSQHRQGRRIARKHYVLVASVRQVHSHGLGVVRRPFPVQVPHHRVVAVVADNHALALSALVADFDFNFGHILPPYAVLRHVYTARYGGILLWAWPPQLDVALPV